VNKVNLWQFQVRENSKMGCGSSSEAKTPEEAEQKVKKCFPHLDTFWKTTSQPVL
jgi:hypothetical protein